MTVLYKIMFDSRRPSSSLSAPEERYEEQDNIRWWGNTIRELWQTADEYSDEIKVFEHALKAGKDCLRTDFPEAVIASS